MFETYQAASSRPLPKWMFPTIGIALLAHVVVLGGLGFYQIWKVGFLSRPTEGVGVVVNTPNPSGGGPKAGRRREQTQPKDPGKQIVKGVHQVDTKATQNFTETDRANSGPVGDGNLLGSEGDGDGSGGDGEGPPCTVPPCGGGDLAPPPEVAKKEPEIIEPSVGDTLRTSGDPRILPDEMDRQAIKDANQTRVISVAKICISTSGGISSVDLLKSSGYPTYDQKIKANIRTWKYKAFTVNGVATPACTTVTFIYNQQN